MSKFESVPNLPPDQIFGVVYEFAQDQRPNKLNLCIGVYRGEDGTPFIFDAVKKVEAHFFDVEDNKEYLPIRGEADFCIETAKLVYGERLYSENESGLYVNQTPGGTGALRAGADFVREQLCQEIFVPDPTWVNHVPLFEKVGLEVKRYPYFHGEKKHIDFEKTKEGIRALPEGACVLFHAACHNPSGCDPTDDEWKELTKILKERKILPFVDFAYQGFGNGIDSDAFFVRHLLDEGIEHLIAYSYSKNMGLYGERTGALLIFSDKKEVVEPVGSYIRSLVRTNYSNSPRHGAMLAKTVLGDQALCVGWMKELESVRLRILSLREKLQKRMQEELPDHDWSFFTRQKGMFSMCGFELDIVRRLKNEFGIYMTDSARINVAALNDQTIEYFIESIKKAHT